MATRPEVEQQIGFALHQLGTKSRHHEFEHVCRRLARERICANILPATGPVSSGGDKGRDFETFRTYLREHAPSQGSWFVGRVAKGPVAFACTIQKDGVSSKVKSDIRSICGGGVRPLSIHFFSVSPVPVAKRHELQRWARENYSIELEIYDSEFLSEHLADPDLFWIASEYLSVPLEIYPPPLEQDDGYERVRAKWNNDEGSPYSHADFVELRSAAISLLSEEHRRPDIGFWLDQLRTFFEPSGTAFQSLKERARYEYLVLSLRVKGDLYGAENVLRDALADAAGTTHWAPLMDGTTLGSYAFGAALAERIGMELSEVDTLCRAIAARTQELLDSSGSSSERCWLLYIVGFQRLCQRFTDGSDDAIFDAFRCWNQVLDEAVDARLFPITRMSRQLTELVPVLADHSGYEELVERCDELVGKREGDHARATACLKRAAKLHRSSMLVKAVREINRGKVLAYSQERLPQVTAAILYAARLYQELGCCFASKYYGLAAAHLAIRHHNERPELLRYVRQALVWCGECDYINGAFGQALEFIELGLKAEWLFECGDGEIGEDDDFIRSLMYGGYILGAAAEISEPLREAVKSRMETWPYAEDFLAAEDAARAVLSQEPRGLQDGLPVYRGSLFGDLEVRRSAVWSALGVRWEVTWPTTAELGPLAEQFIAVLQIVCVDLARFDLYVVPGECHIDIDISDAPDIERRPDNTKSLWSIVLPRKRDESHREGHLNEVAMVLAILSDLSLKPALLDDVESAYKDGLAGNALVVGEYSQLWGSLVDLSHPTLPKSTALSVPPNDVPHSELAWNDGLIAEYDSAKVRADLINRYERTSKGTQYTLPRWLKAGGDEIARELRSEGWLDWQILGALLSFIINFRAAKKIKTAVHGDKADLRVLLQKFVSTDESQDMEPVPLQRLTVDVLRQFLKHNMVATLNGQGLSPRQQTPNFDGISRFLRYKLRYFDGDIDHRDPFAPPAAN